MCSGLREGCSVTQHVGQTWRQISEGACCIRWSLVSLTIDGGISTISKTMCFTRSQMGMPLCKLRPYASLSLSLSLSLFPSFPFQLPPPSLSLFLVRALRKSLSLNLDFDLYPYTRTVPCPLSHLPCVNTGCI